MYDLLGNLSESTLILTTCHSKYKIRYPENALAISSHIDSL